MKVRRLIPRKPVKKVNPKRRKREFARCYGSKVRVEFVKSLPCAACGVLGYSENAHVPPTIFAGGMGRKAAARFIVPLCGVRGHLAGCHWQMHSMGREEFEIYHDIDLDWLAAQTEAAWLSSLGSSQGGET